MHADSILLTALLLAGAGRAQEPEPQPLGLHIVASESYRTQGVSFDFAEEQKRLRAWLAAGAHRAELQRDALAIARFNELDAEHGGARSRHLRWAPHVVRAATGGKGWRPSLRDVEGVVAVADAGAYREPPASAAATLLELVPINGHQPSFGGADIDPAGVRAGVAPETAEPCVFWAVKPERAGALKAWSTGNLGRRCAITVGGLVRAAPVLVSALGASGTLTCGLTAAEATELAATIAAAGGVAVPSNTVVDVGAGSGTGVPAGNDPADLRAMQGAQAMLAAERRLRELIRDGKVQGIDRILTFEEISSWPYEDGLLGMPAAVKKLDGKKVLMTGFMLPIDEVENIKEFLLVQSLWSCCYGSPPDINGIVRVVMQGKARIDYQFEPIKVVGTFRVEAAMEEGYCVDIYQLHASEVKVIH